MLYCRAAKCSNHFCLAKVIQAAALNWIQEYINLCLVREDDRLYVHVCSFFNCMFSDASEGEACVCGHVVVEESESPTDKAGG